MADRLIAIRLRSARLPASIVLILWFALQLVSNLLAKPGSGGVAFRAHIGGFVAGVLFVLLIWIFKKRGVRMFNPPRLGT